MAVFTDLMMRGRSGWDVLNVMKKDSLLKDVPVIVTSILDERAKTMDLGAFDFLLKPFVHARIGEILGTLSRGLPKAA